MGLSGTFIPSSNKLFKLNWASGGGDLNQRDFVGPEYSIFVGDLGPEVHDNLLLITFQSRYASCRSAKVVTDPMTGLSRGYGFVRFGEEHEQQRSMVEMQGVYCGARSMRISVATPKGRFGAGYGSWIVGGAQQASANWQAPGSPMFTDPNNTTVFVGGLTGAFVSEEELAEHFASWGPIVYVKIPPGKGCGFVSFVHRHSAEQAIGHLNGTMLAGNRIRLSWGRSNASLAGIIPNGSVMTSWKEMAMNSPHPYSVSAPVSPVSSPDHLMKGGNPSIYSTTPSLDRSNRSTPVHYQQQQHHTHPVSHTPQNMHYQNNSQQHQSSMMTNSVALLRENLDESYNELEDFIWKKGSSFYSTDHQPSNTQQSNNNVQHLNDNDNQSSRPSSRTSASSGNGGTHSYPAGFATPSSTDSAH